MSSGLHDPPWGESDTRSKLIDPAIRLRGWTEEHSRREETGGCFFCPAGFVYNGHNGQEILSARGKYLADWSVKWLLVED